MDILQPLYIPSYRGYNVSSTLTWSNILFLHDCMHDWIRNIKIKNWKEEIMMLMGVSVEI